MELIALRTFQAVVEEGSIVAAARKLNTVQSNVTSRIRRLEEELGTELFFRKGRGLELAPPGRVLREYAQRMLQLERQTSAALRHVGEGTGELHLGTMETFAAMHLPDALKKLRQHYPALELRISTDTSALLTEKVLTHRLDAAFICGPVHHPELQFESLITEELVEINGRGYDSADLPLILFREGCAYRARALGWQRCRGQAAGEIMEFGTLDGILGCVAVGLGWSLMPRRLVEHSRHAADLEWRSVPPAQGIVPTGIVHRHDMPPMKALDVLCTALRPAQSAAA